MRALLLTAAFLASASTQVFAQATPAAAPVAAPAAAAAIPPINAIPPKLVAASTPESRSAAALAISSEPVLDEGTAQRIKDALVAYKAIAAQGGWPTIPMDAKFAIGAASPHDDVLRQRLIVTGDLARDKATGAYDETLAEAVKRYQARNGIVVTGLAAARTIAALNIPVAKRIKQLEASLERVLNMNFKFGPRYVVVNIPSAFAEAIENGVVVRRYRVIVGKTEKPSPTLTAEISNVNLNPTWTVPSSIVKNEIVAHMRKDPGYLTRMHMSLLDARGGPVDPASVNWSAETPPNVTVRQDSGTWNALGAVRIDMPNSYSVYMHDTNQKNLFSNDYRFDSHGCARIDNVRDLAAWILKDTPWDRQQIDAAIATGQRENIGLARKIPVAWTYLTGWMTRDRVVQFRNDIYDQDTQLVEATAEEASFFSHASGHPLATQITR